MVMIKIREMLLMMIFETQIIKSTSSSLVFGKKNPSSLASFRIVFLVLLAATRLGNIILLLLLSAGPNQH